MTETSPTPDATPAGPGADGTTGADGAGGEVPEGHVLVLGPDGEPIGSVPAAMVAQAVEAQDDAEPEERGITELVEQPAKVMRIGSMIRQLLEEVKAAPLDEASRARLKDIHRASIKELESGLAPELIEELERIALPFTEDDVPSESELRIAQAQLVGWLEGLFHGIQTAIYAQQMVSRAQLEQMRKALPPGMGGPGQAGHPGHPGQGGPGQPGGEHPADEGGAPSSGGMYL